MITTKAGYEHDPLTRRIFGDVDGFVPHNGTDTSIAPVTLLMIDNGASKTDVLNAINQLVNVKGRRGKSGPVDYLKKLGAQRLQREHGNWETARKYAIEHRTPNGIAPTYPTQEQWCRAKTAAQKNCQSVMRRLI